MKKIILLTVLLASAVASSAATLYHDSAAAAVVNHDGSAFAGGVARFGYFPTGTNFSGSVASLESAFVQVTTYTLTSGSWNATSAFTAGGNYSNGNLQSFPYDSTPLDNSPTTGDLAGENMFLWVLNNANSSLATQHGIFSAPGVWTWIDANEPGANGDSNFSLSIGTDSGLIANIGTAQSDAAVGGGTGHRLAQVGVIPEPSKAIFGFMGLSAMLFRRRRAAK